MNAFNNDNPIVAFLEQGDLVPQGNLLNINIPNQDKHLIVMMQGSFCPHCTTAKPDFAQAAQMNQNIIWTTVQIDGSDSEQTLSKSIEPLLKQYQGVPHYFAVKSNGHIVEHNGGRDSNSLLQFSNSL